MSGPGPDLIAIFFQFNQSMNRPQAGLLNLGVGLHGTSALEEEMQD